MNTNRKFRVTDKTHPAYGKYFRIRRINYDYVLAEWCTWSYICTRIDIEQSEGLDKYLYIEKLYDLTRRI